MKVKPFYWSVRRELWENRAIWMVPLAVTGLVLVAIMISSFHLPRAVHAAQADPRAARILMLPYTAAGAAVLLSSWLVSIFYSLGALHGERRDRSILFWKSLPVSDLTTVLSKAAIPMIVQPVLILALCVVGNVLIFLWCTLIVMANGIDPSLMWRHLHLPFMWGMMAYGLALNILWDAPFYGWLFLVSAWAKRMTFVWALAPWLGAALFEFLAFRGRYVIRLLEYRIFGGTMVWSAHGDARTTISSFSQVDPVGFFTTVPLWTGLAFGIACFAACVWLRRRAEPL